MRNNQKEIQDTCKNLHLFLNKNHVYQFKNSRNTVGNLGILPVNVALSIVSHVKMPDLVARINEAEDMVHYWNTSKSDKLKTKQLIKNIAKDINIQYESYTKLNKKYPNCFVYTNLKKVRKGMLPTAKSFSKAFYQHENKQLKAVNDLCKQASRIADKAMSIPNEPSVRIKKISVPNLANITKLQQTLPHDISAKEGKLVNKLNNICKKYSKAFNDKYITAPKDLHDKMIESVLHAQSKLADEIANMDYTNPRQHLVATDYDFIINHCKKTDYIEDFGNLHNKSRISLLKPEAVADIASRTATQASKERRIITKRICHSMHLY